MTSGAPTPVEAGRLGVEDTGEGSDAPSRYVRPSRTYSLTQKAHAVTSPPIPLLLAAGYSVRLLPVVTE